MRRLQALLALLSLVLGSAILPLCACVGFVEHHCCCHERVTEPTADAGPKSCCQSETAPTMVIQAAALADVAVATLPPTLDSLIPPAARYAEVVARPRSPVIAMPRGPPKVPIFLQVLSLLR